MILAAGRGKRMEGLTEDRPKPMLPLRGKPLLEHILDRLREAAFQEVLIVTGYRAEAIESYFERYPMNLVYRRQETINGTARAALLAREFCGDDSFLLTYGDILTEPQDYRAMAEKLESDAETSAVLAVKWVDDPWQGAAVYEESGRVTRIIEKPPRATSATRWNSAGSYTFRPEIFAELERTPLSPRGEYEITSAIQQLIAAGSRVLLHPLAGAWRDVGRPSDLDEAERLV